MEQPFSPSISTVASGLAAGERLRGLLIASAAFGLLTGAGAARGGYFPGAWGWLTLAAAWIAALALVLDRPVAVSRAGLAALGLLTTFAGWTLLSVFWSVDVTQSVLEAQRVLVYVAGFGALLLLARRARLALLGGTWAAILVVCSYALATRLVPDRFGVVDALAGNRLAEPLGYWNSLGLFATLGTLLALGLATRGGAVSLRIAAAASLPPLVATLYFTYSRGAWISLFAGLAVWIAVDRRRLHALVWLAATAPWSAVAVVLAWHYPTLTSATLAPVPVLAHDGHRLTLLLGSLVAGSAATAAVTLLLERRVAPAGLAQRRIGRALAGAVVVAAVALFANLGAPWTLAARSWHDFVSAPPIAASTTLNARLFNVSGSGRVDQWRIAWNREVTSHPLLGTGAATYERYWDRYRATPGKVRNVHNLYLEVLATLGVVGLLLLLGALGTPVVAALRARGTPLVPAALAAWSAYLVHALVDWDWQITAVTLAAFACAAALFPESDAEATPRGRRLGIAAAIVAGGLGVYGIAMQTSLSRIDANAADPAKAAAAARTAADLQPWSTEPWQRLAEDDLSGNHFAAARAALARALAQDPDDWSLWYDLGRASAPVPRIAALRRATELNPLSPEVARFRALVASLSELGKQP